MAYNYTIDRNKLIEITATYRDVRTNNVIWNIAVPKLNEYFKEDGTRDIWRRRVQRAIDAVGNALDSVQPKEIPNIDTLT